MLAAFKEGRGRETVSLRTVRKEVSPAHLEFLPVRSILEILTSKTEIIHLGLLHYKCWNTNTKLNNTFLFVTTAIENTHLS